MTIGAIFKKIRESLYWKISGLFLLILILIGIAYVITTISVTRKYFDEATQRLNAHVAEQMLSEVTPFVDGKVNEDALGKIMHSMMAVNPGLEVYLLDPQGKILSFVVFDKDVKLQRVSLEPIKEFIDNRGNSLVYGDDPKNPGETKIFSATPVYEEGALRGYVYMILASEEYANIISALQKSYLLQIGLKFFLLTLVFAFVIGLITLWLLMKSLRDIVGTVKQFDKGDYSQKIPIRTTGELAELATTVNAMAETMLRNIEELKEVDKLRRDLIANISHDIRTPISIIHGYIETLIIKRDTLDAQKQEEYLQTILKSTEKLKRLMSDLFELSKLEARQVKPKMESFFMFDLLQDATRKYKLMAQERGISFETDFNSKSPMVHADVAMIERVIQNLIDNALNYTPEEGKIKIVLNEDESNITVSVSNTGKGIPEDELPKIFDRYYKVNNSQGVHGTGLGLAIVKNILEIHQSTIHVISERLGTTTFSFNLPIVA